jgi:hypothetical protein
MSDRTPDQWSHKDEWKRHGNDFCVVVSRHEGSTYFGEGPNRWCVYAFIYPKHPYFKEFDQSGPMYQDAASAMPLHGGPTLLEFPMYDGAVTSVKVGADYQHLYDDRFSHYATKDEAYEVFKDAEKLFDWLTKVAVTAKATEEQA